ncbi:MAG: mannose-6-phosphate isomerase [Verrucomicrobia bacterium]|nr:MAG: mannose-6-phosphate isomerase [Verrucomicrobiota bacterium]
MRSSEITQPLAFEPIFMERIWGGRRLKSKFRKKLPPDAQIGESWEIVDRPGAQSIVWNGPLRGETLHELWTQHRQEIFGDVPATARFPLVAKLIDARAKLSLQVHPPSRVAKALGGEMKDEIWYVLDAVPDAQIYAGLRSGVTREQFGAALENSTVAELVHRISVKRGDAIFMPSGRLHTMGDGILVAEIQQNSDTTYRVFDWNRVGTDGEPRRLHVREAMQSIDFTDIEPDLIQPRRETLVSDSAFVVEKWDLISEREAAPLGKFAILLCLNGEIDCAGLKFKQGDFFLVPGTLQDRNLHPRGADTSLLRTMLPEL